MLEQGKFVKLMLGMGWSFSREFTNGGQAISKLFRLRQFSNICQSNASRVSFWELKLQIPSNAICSRCGFLTINFWINLQCMHPKLMRSIFNRVCCSSTYFHEATCEADASGISTWNRTRRVGTGNVLFRLVFAVALIWMLGFVWTVWRI